MDKTTTGLCTERGTFFSAFCSIAVYKFRNAFMIPRLNTLQYFPRTTIILLRCCEFFRTCFIIFAATNRSFLPPVQTIPKGLYFIMNLDISLCISTLSLCFILLPMSIKNGIFVRQQCGNLHKTRKLCNEELVWIYCFKGPTKK